MKRPSATKQRAFLAAYAESASITKAAKAAKVDRGAHYDWLETDPTYPPRFKAACDQFGDNTVAEMKRRAMDGWNEPVIYHGELCYVARQKKKKGEDGAVEIVTERTTTPLTILKKSDRLLEKLAGAFKPELFRERVSAELTGKDGGAIEVSLAAILRERRERREGPDDGR